MTGPMKRALIALATLVGVIVLVAVLAPGGCRGSTVADVDAGGGASPSITASAASAAPSASAPPEIDLPTYEVVAADSKATLAGTSAAGKYTASFAALSGTLKLNGNQIAGSAFELSLDSASVRADTDAVTDQLKSADLLEADRYPQTTFVSTRLEEAKGDEPKATHVITGNLTLHGVLKSMRFPAAIELDGDRLHIAAKVALQRSDFGIVGAGKPNDPFPDKARLELDLKLVKKPPRE